GIEIDPGLPTEGDVDAFPDPFYLGPGDLLLGAFGLSVHPVSNITTGGAPYHSAYGRAQGGIPTAHIVAGAAPDDGPAAGAHAVPFLGVVRVFNGITAQDQPQGHTYCHTS